MSSSYPPTPTKHNKKRRARWHNYRLPGWYMLTITTLGRQPLFGTLILEPAPYISLSPLGRIINDVEIAKISRYYPNVVVHQICIMPDHIHLLVQVKEAFPKRKHLGYVVSGFKSGCNGAYRSLMPGRSTTIFEEGYHDRIIFGDRHILRWRSYMVNNPKRLAIKRQHPDYFTVFRNIEICGEICSSVGNRFLLDIPDKEAVIVHSLDDDETKRANFARWMECGERGGVLVSASIAKEEKEVLREARNRGYPIILLRENGFEKYFKPGGNPSEPAPKGCCCRSPHGSIIQKQERSTAASACILMRWPKR